MYVISFYNKRTFKTEETYFFAGNNEKYKTLSEARIAAEIWKKNHRNYEDLQTDERIVGCL